jgi:anti-sigma factor RsiW
LNESTIDELLVGYHFGTSSDEEREQIDAHLLGCSRCLKNYLRLKHHLDGQARALRPSSHVRERLRAEVDAAFRPRGIDRVRAWLAAPIPRGRGIAAAAALAIAAAVIVAMLPLPVPRNAPTPSVAAQQQIDPARPSAESSHVY